MNDDPETLKKAKTCLECPICSRARKNQRGLAYLFVKHVDRKVCPACKAYEQVTGRMACDPVNKDIINRLTNNH